MRGMRRLRASLAVWLAILPLVPAARAAPDVAEDAVVAAIPFADVDAPNRIYVDLSPEGSPPLPWLLDTGATGSVMTPLAARRLGVSVRAIKDTPYRRETRIGRDVQFWVDTISSDTGSKTGWEYALLGGNFLREYVVELDFTARRVRFLDPKRYGLREVGAASEQEVLVLRDSPRPIAEIAIDGKPLSVMFDTGSPWPLILSGAAAKKVGIDIDSLEPFLEGGTTVGPMALRLLPSAEVSFGALRFANVPILVAPKGWYGILGESNDSAVGYDLISRFLVRIDYRGRRMLLRRESDQVVMMGVDYGLVRETGAFLAPYRGGVVVAYVLPGSPAERLGLRAGDRVDRDSKHRSPEHVLRKIKEGGSVLVVRDDDGILADVLLEPKAGEGAPPK
jgi:predicted aspartyl protease